MERKQTIHTLRTLSVEELYELTDAILTEDWPGIKEELGHSFLHLLFYARIGKEQNRFTLVEVLDGISDKLIARHPHIYGDVKVIRKEDVNKIGKNSGLREGKRSVLSGVPNSLPALVKAIRLQEKSKQVGFEWSNAGEVWKKVEEESGELQEAVRSGDQRNMEEEFGDLMFSMINYARFLRIDAESALERTNLKFIRRFTLMEETVALSGKQMSDLSLTELDEIWKSRAGTMAGGRPPASPSTCPRASCSIPVS